MATVLVVTVVAYAPVLDAGFLNLDDYRYVTVVRPFGMAAIGNVLTRPCEGYQPLSLISLGLTTEVFGFNPWPHHAFSLLLHLANVLLVFLLVRRLAASDRIGLFAAACFALLPAHVEAVAWIASRKDVLYAFFYLLGLLAYLRYRERPTAGRYAAVGACLVLSSLSKGMAVAFPLSLLAVDLLVRPAASVRRLVVEKAPFFAVAALFGWLSVGAQQASGYAGREISLAGIVGRAGLAGQAFLAYAGHMVNPDALAAFHPAPTGDGWACGAPFGAGLLAAWASAAVWAWRRSRLPAFGWIFFAVNLVFVLQFVPVAEFLVADRYLYVAAVGAAVAFAVLVDRAMAQRGLVRIAPLSAAAVLAALAVTSWAFAREWSDSLAVWSRVLARHPDSVFALNLRAGAWLERGAPGKALADLDCAVAREPGYARTYLNRGVARERGGDGSGAMSDYDAFVSLQPLDPQGYNNRALLLMKRGGWAPAVTNLTVSVLLGTGHPLQHVFLANRAEARLRGGDIAGAVDDAEAAVRLHPRHYRAFLVLAEAALKTRDPERAEACLRAAEALDPADPAPSEMRKRYADGASQNGLLP
jgi:tetratricopeptide (TPR) repeat protein